jgi:Nuclease-related domain
LCGRSVWICSTIVDVRVELLSDHGGEELRRTTRRLTAAGAEVAAQEVRYRQAWADLEAARCDKSLWRRILSRTTPTEREALERVRGSWAGVAAADAGRRAVHGRRQRQAAGIEGEDALVRELSVLPDDWLTLRGYHNRRGETDHVLVGPRGVWAVEVKRWRVRLYVVDDRWWFERLDRNKPGTGRAVDGGGRTGGRQVGDVAGDLAAWLDRNGQRVRVHTAVMLMHEHAVVARCERPAVDLVSARPDRLLTAILAQPPALPRAACAEIVRLVRADHVRHAGRRRGA